MNKSIVSFSIQAVIVSLFLSLAVSVVLKNWFPQYYFGGFFGVIVLVLVVTILFHSLLIKATAARPMSFINKFIAFTGAKLLLYLFIILGYVFIVSIQPVSFLLIFLCSYIVLTVFEVISILNFLKKNYSQTGAANQ